MSIRYLARGKRMAWYDWFTLLKTRGLLMPAPLFSLYLQYPPIRCSGIYPTTTAKELETKAELANDLFDRRPDLLHRYGVIGFLPMNDGNPRHPLYRFIVRWYHWMQKGFTKDVAYEKTEEEFGKVIQSELKHMNALKEVANYKSAVNYHTYYDQLAHNEGRLKVKRLMGDLEKHKRMQNYGEIDATLPIGVRQWERVRARYYPQSTLAPPPETTQAVKTRFQEKVEFIYKSYKQKEELSDGLRGLYDSLVVDQLKEAPAALLKQVKEVYKEMVEAGVKLAEDGSVDVSKVKDQELAKAIRESEFLKTVLQTRGEIQVRDSGKPTKTEVQSPPPAAPDDIHAQRREHLKGLWAERESRKRDPSEQLALHSAAIATLRRVRKTMDVKLIKSGLSPVFPPAAASYKDDMYVNDQGLDLKALTDYMKGSSENPLLSERERFEMKEAENLAEPVNVIEDSAPITTDEAGSSLLQDQLGTFIDRSTSELNELSQSTFDNSAKELTEFEMIEQPKHAPDPEYLLSTAPTSAPDEDSGFDDLGIAEEIFGESEESGPSTLKERPKVDKRQGKVSSAVAKLGRKK